jgi:hypothetical protein
MLLSVCILYCIDPLLKPQFLLLLINFPSCLAFFFNSEIDTQRNYLESCRDRERGERPERPYQRVRKKTMMTEKEERGLYYMRTRVPICVENNDDSDREIREGYSTMRTRVLISGARIIIAACRSWIDEGDVEEKWDVRGERLSIYILENK